MRLMIEEVLGAKYCFSFYGALRAKPMVPP